MTKERQKSVIDGASNTSQKPMDTKPKRDFTKTQDSLQKTTVKTIKRPSLTHEASEVELKPKTRGKAALATKKPIKKPIVSPKKRSAGSKANQISAEKQKPSVISPEKVTQTKTVQTDAAQPKNMTQKNDADALFAQNIQKIEELSQRLIAALAQKKEADPALSGPSSDVYAKVIGAYVAKVIEDPSKVIEHQLSYWSTTLRNYQDAQQAFLAAPSHAEHSVSAPSPSDRRFANPMWEQNPFFKYIKQQYFLNADMVSTALKDVDLPEGNSKQRAEYFIRQLVDMFAPTNFLGLNPDALEKALETNGESLVRGLENLVRDVEANNGDVLVTLADPSAFQLGENIATTPGRVVYKNHMFELIYYTPTTQSVYETPLIIFPPWINKFYILDLKPANSFVKWLVEQGYSVFIISWANPDASYADIGMDDYVRDGYLRAIAEVKRLTKQKRVNAVGYCIAGTTLALTLAYMHKIGDKSVASATFLTTLTDFSDPGEMGVFLTDDFVDGIERQSQRDGMLSKLFMGRTFSFLRSNDLIYQPAIKSYMMGESPPAFDLLFWNGDGTNLPARMAVEYLRGLCQRNGFVQGQFPILGEKVRLSDVQIPLVTVACESDHIAHWKGCFNGFRQMGTKDKMFILSQSGHISGIVNPPSKNKYGYYVNNESTVFEADSWKETAQFTQGSWWLRWNDWLKKRSGRRGAAPDIPVNKKRGETPAPGVYVKKKAS